MIQWRPGADSSGSTVGDELTAGMDCAETFAVGEVAAFHQWREQLGEDRLERLCCSADRARRADGLDPTHVTTAH